MKVKIQGTKLKLTPSITEYVETKVISLERFLKRIEAEGEMTAFVEIARTTRHHKTGDVYYAEITLQLPGKTLRAESSNSDIRAAIDIVKDKIREDLSKYKERAISKKTGR